MALSPEELIAAGDQLVEDLHRSKLLSKKELEGIRKDLQRSMRSDATGALGGMQTAKIGRTRVLIPNSPNLRAAGIAARRTRQRMSAFRLRYTDRERIEEMIKLGQIPDDPSKFIRHSRRMARNARDYMERLGELEPALLDDDEFKATMEQLEDNNLDLLKLEVKSFTRSQENLQRMVNGRMMRTAAGKQIQNTDLSMQLWNQSVLEHPQAVTRSMLGKASERMGQRIATTVSEVPKRSWVYVGVPRDVATKMAPGSRTAKNAWRLFSTGDLDAQFAKKLGSRQTASTWRGLGEGFGTEEIYVPIPEGAITDELREILRERRAAMMRKLREQTAST